MQMIQELYSKAITITWQVRSVQLIVGEVTGKFWGGVGVAYSPGFVVYDNAFKAEVGIDVGYQGIKSFQLSLGIVT